ncbi:MAG: glycosyltransferase family 32 protein, partial [Acidomyces sp. 'richmondensis']
VILITCHHIRDLGEVGRTYLTFNRLIKHHQDVLFQYRPSREGKSLNSEQQCRVPKIIHQVFLADGRNSSLDKYEDALASCHRLHPSWEYRLWTDDNSRSFVRDQYANILPHYKNYRQSIQRANILRYLLLHHYGGVYLDLDITCLTPLDELLHLSWLTPGAYPAGVNNAYVLARKRHTFLVKLLQNVPSRDMRWPMPYVENMLTTGCMFFANRWMRYAWT